jgi:hypothetical protein
MHFFVRSSVRGFISVFAGTSSGKDINEMCEVHVATGRLWLILHFKSMLMVLSTKLGTLVDKMLSKTSVTKI